MVRILQITDLHILAQPGQTLLGVDTGRSFSDVLQKARREQSDVRLVLLTGDLAQDPVVETYTRLRGWLQTSGWEYYCLPGNHDDPALMAASLCGSRVHYQQQILLDHWQIICLDSSVRGSPGGFLAEAQLDYLEACLSRYPGHHALVALHHHPILTGSAWLDTMVLGNKDSFMVLLQRFPQVRVVLSGHVHQCMSLDRNGVRFLATPATCFQFKPHTEAFALDEKPPGYRWLELGDEGSFTTGVERLDDLPQGLDRASSGY